MRLSEEYKRRILRYMGHFEGGLSKELERLLEKAFSRITDKVQPMSRWEVFSKEDLEGIFIGKDLNQHFERATHGAIFAVTLGKEMERLIEEGQARSPLEGLVYESIGSVYVETLVEGLRQKLEGEWKGVLPAFSPGYGDCPLNLQEEILHRLGAGQQLEVYMTDYHLLVPRKTITGFIPLKKEAAIKKRSKCQYCNQVKTGIEHCAYNEDKIGFFDGGLGTELQGLGFQRVENLATLNLSHPEAVLKAHEAFVHGGAEYLSTNTFSANPLKINNKKELESIISKGVELAKKAKPERVFLDIGPLGVLMRPQGDFTFERAYSIFYEVIKLGLKNGVDGILLETFTDLYEIKAAIYAAREQTDLPIFATMSFEKNGRTFLGLEPKIALRALEAFGADVVGVNCSVGPKEMIPWIRESMPYLSKPVMVQGNAGIPTHHKGKDRFPLSPGDYADYAEELYEAGVKIFGGCCGTGPATIKALRNKLSGRPYRPREKSKMDPFICSYNQGLFIEEPTIVGERINPTGKPHLEKALKTGDYGAILQEGILQRKEGARILDVNTGIAGVREDTVLPEVIQALQQVVPIPLQIDTSDVNALGKALRIYNGVPIINSVNGGKVSLEKVLPLAKKYGASIIALTLDDQGLPKTAEKRIEIAKKIIHRGKALGIPKERFIFDPLALTVAHEGSQVKESLKALRIMKRDLGCKTILGLSNISYGMPNRNQINRSFLTLALYEGLDLLMMDPGDPGMKEALALYKLLSNQDPQGKSFSRNHSPLNHEGLTDQNVWKNLLLDGDAQAFLKEIKRWMNNRSYQRTDYENFIEEELLHAFDFIGDLYDREEVYLPQLIQGAEVLKAGIRLINKELSADESKGEQPGKNGKILLATVEGDLHDIGKNIFKILVENYGFPVKDLGKDVKIEKILETMKEEPYAVVGLSALMTTTLGSMEKSIKAIKTHYPESRIIVGGAVITETYAKKMGADAYAKDARQGVHQVKNWLG